MTPAAGAGTRFLLSGYYGFGNLGDEALLQVIVERLRARWPACAVDVLSGDPAATARAYGVEATPRMDLARVRSAIDAADVVLSGGGGLLQNVTSLKSLLYYSGVIRSAIRAGKPTMVFAQSIGPLDFWGRAMVRNFCKGLRAATVRDERSRTLLRSLLPGVPVERTADPVFLFEPGGEPLDLAAEGLAGDDAPLVVVSVRKWQGAEATAHAMASVVDHLAGRHGARVAFLPLGGPPDAEVATTIIRRCASTPGAAPRLSPRPSGAGDRARVARDRDALARADHRRAAGRAVPGAAVRSEGDGAARGPALSRRPAVRARAVRCRRATRSCAASTMHGRAATSWPHTWRACDRRSNGWPNATSTCSTSS